MKKLLLSAVLLFVGIAVIAPAVNAQTNAPTQPFKYSPAPDSKVGESKILTPISKGESRALKNFNKNYKHSANVDWYQSGKLFVAAFSEDNTKKKVMYLGSGQWLRTLIYYDESQLSDYVKSMVTRNYPKFKITGVTEVHERDMIAYFINIENDKEIKQVISFEDQVWTHMQFRKS